MTAVDTAFVRLVEALREGRDVWGFPVFPGGFANAVAQAIDTLVAARLVQREAEILAMIEAAIAAQTSAAQNG